MTAQHTPGPWLTQQHCAIVPLPANTYTRIYAHRPGGEDITIGYKALGRSEEDEANARLLTAGPGLLAMLKKVYAHAHEHPEALPSALREEIRKVITEVEGEI
jgi:hypothetical protein